MSYSVSFPLVGDNHQSTPRGSGSLLTPCSNTGLNRQVSELGWSCRVDWLQFIVDDASVPIRDWVVRELEQLLRVRFSRKWDEPRVMGIRWDGYAISPSSAMVCWVRYGDDSQPLAERTRGAVWVSLPGECWSAASPEIQQRLLRLVGVLSARVTRLDLALDDYARELDLGAVESAVLGGHYCGCRRFQVVRSGGLGKFRHGLSIVLGSPQSAKRLVIYDKLVESNGRIPSIRLELRLRDRLAHSVWASLMAREFSSVAMAQAVVSAVQFRSGEKLTDHVARRPLLPWWHRFLRRLQVEPARLPRVLVRRSLQKTVDWLARQVSGSLGVVSQVLGRGVVDRLVDFGIRLAERKEAVRTRVADWSLNREQIVCLFGEFFQVGSADSRGRSSQSRGVPSSTPSPRRVESATSKGFNAAEVGSSPEYIAFEGMLFKTLGAHHGIPPWIWESV